jgi:hypothetical protein
MLSQCCAIAMASIFYLPCLIADVKVSSGPEFPMVKRGFKLVKKDESSL